MSIAKKKKPNDGTKRVEVRLPGPLVGDLIAVAGLAKVSLDTVVAVFIAAAVMQAEQSQRGTK